MIIHEPLSTSAVFGFLDVTRRFRRYTRIVLYSQRTSWIDPGASVRGRPEREVQHVK